MQQAIKIILLSVSIFVLCNVHLATAADPIADRTARYQCFYDNSTANVTILTLDVNTVHLKRGNQQISDKFDLQNKTELDKTNGKCTLANETIQHFSLELSDQDHLQFYFEGNSSSYHLEKIIYTRKENGSRSYGLNKPDLRFAGNALKTEIQGYKCGKLALTLADEQNSDQAEVKLGDFMFFAFENNIETSKVTRIECRQTAGSSIIPMVVGGGLLGFAAVVVIAYFIMRKKDTIWPDNDKARSP